MSMVRKMEHLDTSAVARSISEGREASNYVGDSFTLVLDSGFMHRQIRLQQPYRVAESRIARIVSGEAVYRLNLVDHRISTDDFLFMPRDTIVEVERLTDDYALEVLVVSSLPGISHDDVQRLTPQEVIHLRLDADGWQRSGEYFALMARQLHRPSPVFPAVSHLVMSLLADVGSLWHTMEQSFSARRQSRSEEVFARFLALLRQHGMTERSIPFYADRLNLTPNHLSAVVRQQSGLSVMDWLHRTTVMEAKVLLKHTSLMMYEIADRLNFSEPTAFNRYFKKHTGMTPLEYRENKLPN